MKKFVLIVLIFSFLVSAEIVRKKSGLNYTFTKDSVALEQGEVSGLVKEYYKSGKVSGEFNYNCGLLDGEQKEYYESGRKLAVYQMVNGKKDKTGKMFYDNENNSLKYERELENGTGMGTEYYQNGMKRRLFAYKDGQLLKATFFNEDFEQNRFERTAEELYAEAQSYAAEKLYYHAIDTYKQFIEKYPENEKTPNVEFLIAFTYNNHLSDKDLAKELYGKFIKKYPNHNLVQSAEFELKTMGKDLNEIEEFKINSKQ